MPPWGVVSAAEADGQSLLANSSIISQGAQGSPSKKGSKRRKESPKASLELEFLPDEPSRPWLKNVCSALLCLVVLGVAVLIIWGTSVGLAGPKQEPRLMLPAALHQTWEQYKQQLAASLKSDLGAATLDAAARSLLNKWTWNQYHSPDDAMGFIQWLHDRHPNLISYEIYGKSQAIDEERNPIEPYDLAAVIITNNATDSDRLKPEFKWVAGVHGDEGVGRELLLRLAYHLVTFYDTAAAPQSHAAHITWLLNNTRVVIVHDLNPWGASNASPNNSLGLDLDLSFPVNARVLLHPPPNDAPNPTEDDVAAAAVAKCCDNEAGPVCDWLDAHDKIAAKTRLLALSPAETLAFSTFASARHAVLGASLRSGALGVSYGLDACESAMDVCPDGMMLTSPQLCQPTAPACAIGEEALVTALAKKYAEHHPRMAHIRSGVTRWGQEREFDGGTVHAALWNPHIGSLRDWQYWHTQELTLDVLVDEGATQAHPSLLDVLFLENRASMMALMQRVHDNGFKARLVDSDGLPVHAMMRRLHPGASDGIPLRQYQTSRQGSFILLLEPNLLYCWQLFNLPDSYHNPVLALKIPRTHYAGPGGTWQEPPLTKVVLPRSEVDGNADVVVINGTDLLSAVDMKACQTAGQTFKAQLDDGAPGA